MPGRVHTGAFTETATSAAGPYLRMKYSSGEVVVAGATDDDIGTLTARVISDGDSASVLPPNMEGTVKMVAAGAIIAKASVYGAAGGKIDDTANANRVGIAMEAASGDGSIIEVLRLSESPNAASTSEYGLVKQAAADADITDSSGGTAGSGMAAVTAAATITDSSTGVDPGDDTIAAVTNTDTLTNSTGGSADDTLDAVTEQAGGAGVELTSGDPAKINDNFTELADQIATQKAANTALLAAVAQLAAKQNTTSTAIGVLTDAVAALAAEVNDLKAKLRTSGALAS